MTSHLNSSPPLSSKPQKEKAETFCPSNIALCKYWGKRDHVLNLPCNSSLSISLGKYGTRASVCEGTVDLLFINGKRYTVDTAEHIRLFGWIDQLIGKKRPHLYINTFSNIPMGAGVASSASAFSAILKALNSFFGWGLGEAMLAHFARLGSGSAARSLSRGFVYLKAGTSPDGVDFSVTNLPYQWKEFRIAINYVNRSPKPIFSRAGMDLTVRTSPIYSGWVDYAEKSCQHMIDAIKQQDITKLGDIAERNCLMMHGTMMGCEPPLMYMMPKTLEIIQQAKELREQGIEVYFTIDAGPNVKLIFLKKDESKIKQHFPNIDVISPFESAF